MEKNPASCLPVRVFCWSLQIQDNLLLRTCINLENESIGMGYNSGCVVLLFRTKYLLFAGKGWVFQIKQELVANVLIYFRNEVWRFHPGWGSDKTNWIKAIMRGWKLGLVSAVVFYYVKHTYFPSPHHHHEKWYDEPEDS